MSATNNEGNDRHVVRPSEFPAHLVVKVAESAAPVTIDHITPEGDIQFSVPLRSIGISRAALSRPPVAHTSYFVDMMGQLLLRKNIGLFASRIAQMPAAEYEQKVHAYTYRHFGLTIQEDDRLSFQVHLSLAEAILCEDFEAACQSMCGKMRPS